MSRYNYRENTAGTLDSTHIYYNISFSNPSTGTDVDASCNLIEYPTDNVGITYNFNQSRAAPYLKCPEDYYLSVVRFTIDSPNIPLFCVQPVLGSMDPNETIYSITIMANTNIPFTRSVTWRPQDLDPGVTPPSVPIKQSSISPTDPYYYCNSYTYFIGLINSTFNDIMVEDFGFFPFSAPCLTYDPVTYLFQLSATLGNFRTDTTGNPLQNFSIFFNTPLYNLFSSLPANYVAGKTTVASGYSNLQLDYRMILSTGSDLPGGTQQPFITNVRRNIFSGSNDVYAVQGFSTLSFWNPIQAIVFKTSLLTTRPEIMGTPVVYANNSQNINAARQNAEILNILSEDFSPVIAGTQYKPYIYYEPTAEYKLTDLYGYDPIQAIDITAFWRDKFGNLVPFTIGISCSSTVKILFRKKTFN